MQKLNLNRILHVHNGTNAELIQIIKDKYVGSNPPVKLPDYSGPENTLLDRPITVEELRAVVQKLRTKSTPGPDGISNKTLRNLDEPSLTALAKFMNECWLRGSLPKIWKTAKIVMIPKPGKKLHIDNLRPISLTSCIGKLLEHVVLNRISNYMDDNDLYPHTMIGFRAKLSTQDIMLQIKHQIIDGDKLSPLDTRAILGLDLPKAFDSVTHEAILDGLAKIAPGKRVYNYIREFLTNRTASLSVGNLESGDFALGGRGTPQGSVLSPFLFNVSLLGLPERLSNIKGLHHSL